MKILIAGGGIGGLAAALSLHAVGFTDVRIVEAASELRPIGVGLNVLPNAVRELTGLGLGERIANIAIATQELRLVSRHGQLIWAEPRGLAAGYRWPQLSVHRGLLQGVLVQAVHERLGRGAVVTGTSVVGCEPRSGAGVRVVLRRTETGSNEVAYADLVIGADGIRSAVRSCFYPEEGPPPGNGMVIWRGTTWAEPYLTGGSMIVAGTDTDRLVMYPVARRPGHAGTLINWVAGRPGANGRDSPAGWHDRVSVTEVLDHFGDWRFDWLDIPAVLRAADRVYRYPMVDREPLPRWTFGNATLLGDAAHAMYPVGSNGATQAIMDASALARALAEAGDIPEALARYEAERRPAMTQLQASNRRQGPETAITIVHRRAPNGFDDLNDVISPSELATISAGYAQVGGFDVDRVNDRCPPGPQMPDLPADALGLQAPASGSQGTAGGSV